MNPTTLEAIKLFTDLQALNSENAEYVKRLQKIIDNLLIIIEGDVSQAVSKYSAIKTV